MSLIRAIVFLAVSIALSAQPLILDRLESGKPIQKELAGGQSHSYAVRLQAGQFLHAVVTQLGVDVLVRLFGMDGKALVEVDTIPYTEGQEPLFWVAQSPGDYRLEVNAKNRAANPGGYEIKVEERRATVTGDEKRVGAQQSFREAQNSTGKNAFDRAIQSYEQALSSYRDVHDRPGEALSLNNIGLAYNSLSQYEKAIGYHEQALAIRREVRDRQGEAISLNNLGIACRRLSQSYKAIGYDEQALAIRREIRDRQGEGGSLNNLGIAYESLSQFEKAIGYFEQAVAIARAVKDRQGEGSSLNNLGMAYNSLSQFEKAIGYFEQALAIKREVKDRRGQANNLNNIGLAYHNLSRYEKAIGYGEQALAIRREIKDRQGEATSLNNLANAYNSLSQYEKAIGYGEQALAIRREIRDRQGEGSSLNNLGIAYNSLRQFEKAIGYFEQALAIQREVKDRKGEAGNLNNLGLAYNSLSQYNKAIKLYEQALAIKREIKDRFGEAYSLMNLGSAYNGLNQYEKAIGYYEQSLAISKEIKGQSQAGQALSGLGTTYRDLKQHDKAISFHVRALSTRREIKERSEEADTLSELMFDWQASAQPRLAIFYGKQAVNTFQSIRSDISGLSHESQQSFLKGNEKSYHALADLLISQGRLPEAQQVLNLLKEQEYFEFIRRDSNDAAGLNSRANLTAEEAESEKRYREIGDRMVAIGTEHGSLIGKKTLTPEETRRLAELEKDLETGNAAFQQFLGTLATQFAAKPAATAKLEQVRDTQGLMEDLRELPAGTVAIYTLIGQDKYRAILITPDVQKAYEYPITAADLNGKILAFREAVQNPKIDPRPLGQELYKILLGNMADDLRQANAQTLMWSLDGTLRYVPLAALFDGKRYLIEQYRTAVFTPASNARLKDRPDQRWAGVGFGVTKAHGAAVALPDVTAELAGIIHETGAAKGGVLDGDIKMDEAFTEQSMREGLRKHFTAVHIASHFNFQPGDETKSALLLGDGSLLTLSQIKKLPNLFGGVQVLTLSACNTGVGDNSGDGKEVEGFGVLAQRQGAKAVIASLWPVADASTSRLMQEFYRMRESAAGVTKLEALRQAQLGLLRGTSPLRDASTTDRGLVHDVVAKESNPQAPRFARDSKAPYAHPYFWAPFFLMGNWL